MSHEWLEAVLQSSLRAFGIARLGFHVRCSDVESDVEINSPESLGAKNGTVLLGKGDRQDYTMTVQGDAR